MTDDIAALLVDVVFLIPKVLSLTGWAFCRTITFGRHPAMTAKESFGDKSSAAGVALGCLGVIFWLGGVCLLLIA